MRLTPPSPAIFIISVAQAVRGLLAFTGTLSLNLPAFWLMTAGYVVLLIRNVTRGA